MAKRYQQEVYRVKQAAMITGFQSGAILGAIKSGKLFAWKMDQGRPGRHCYIIPRYALYAWLGHEASQVVAAQFDPSQHRQVMKLADIRKEAARTAKFLPRGPWVWDQQSNPLRHWRKHLGISAMDLARQMGLNERSIYDFERGACKPSFKSLQKYSPMLGLSPERLQVMLNQWRATELFVGRRTSEDQRRMTGTTAIPEFPSLLAKLANGRRESTDEA